MKIDKIDESLKESSPSTPKIEEPEEHIYSDDFDAKPSAIKSEDSSKGNIKNFSDLQKEEKTENPKKEEKRDFFKDNKILNEDSDEIIDEYKF